jgi:hypothetical protein
MMKIVRWAALAVAGCILVFSCSGDRIYFAHKQDPVAAIERIYGEPLWVENRADGSQKMVYRIRDPMSSGYLQRYFIIKDGKVIDGGAI